MQCRDREGIVADLSMRIELTRMIDRTLATKNAELAAILQVAVGTLDTQSLSPPSAQLPEKSPSSEYKMPCRNLRIDGRRTSLKLEGEYWEALDALIAEGRAASLDAICDRARRDYPDRSLASAVRVYVLAMQSKSVSSLGAAGALAQRGSRKRRYA